MTSTTSTPVARPSLDQRRAASAATRALRRTSRQASRDHLRQRPYAAIPDELRPLHIHPCH